jgi:hypothetical protein
LSYCFSYSPPPKWHQLIFSPSWELGGGGGGRGKNFQNRERTINTQLNYFAAALAKRTEAKLR